MLSLLHDLIIKSPAKKQLTFKPYTQTPGTNLELTQEKCSYSETRANSYGQYFFLLDRGKVTKFQKYRCLATSSGKKHDNASHQ